MIDMRRRLTPLRVSRAIESGYRALDWARERYNEDIAYYVGRHHVSGSTLNTTKRPINLIAQAVHALIPNLVLENPRYIVKPQDFRLGGEAMKLQLMSDQQAQEDDDADTIYRPCVAEALFSPLALTYTRIRAGSGVCMIEGEQFDPGQVFTSRLSIEDYACDQLAKAREAITWQGHVFRCSRDLIIDLDLFPGKEDLLAGLPAVHQRRFTEDYDGGDSYDRRENDSMFDMIELWSCEVYHAGQVYEIVMPAARSVAPTFLRFQEYEGPEGGGYDALWFNLVPNCAVPLSPVSVFRDLAEAGDLIANKAINQAIRSKAVLAYTRTAKDDALSAKDAADGEAIAVDDAKAMQVMELNQIIKDLVPFMEWVLLMWNNLSGNPNLIGGQGKIADTATESSILSGAANNRLQDHQNKVTKLARNIGRKRLWYWTNDPLISKPLTTRVAGIDIDFLYDAETRRGTYLDFTLNCEPRSMAGKNPDLQAKRLVEVFGVLPNFQPFIEAGLIDLTALLRVLQREFGVDELAEIVVDPASLMLRDQIQMGMPPPGAPMPRSAFGPPGMVGPGRMLPPGSMMPMGAMGGGGGGGMMDNRGQGRAPSGRGPSPSRPTRDGMQGQQMGAMLAV